MKQKVVMQFTLFYVRTLSRIAHKHRRSLESLAMDSPV
jgi:hypothetical protein